MTMNLTFKRRLTKSVDNKAALISIPRPVANAWKEFDRIEFTFDGECLTVKPIDVHESGSN